MNLLPEEKLIWSPVVANSRMNRQRKASGINSYEQELKFKPEDFLFERINRQGGADWLDICCGEGNALIQIYDYFEKMRLQDRIYLEGVDLMDHFSSYNPLPNLVFKTMALSQWQSSQKFDLITCIHGIHYLGDKLTAVETMVNHLKTDGFFAANLDLNNIAVEGQTAQFIKNLFINKGFTYNSRTKLLSRAGGIELQFGLKYLGADDSFGPNYTGQESVVSHYTV